MDRLLTIVAVVPNNYGYSCKRMVELKDPKIPKSFAGFMKDNINAEIKIKRYGQKKDPYYDKTQDERREIRRLRMELKKLELDSDRIWDREQESDYRVDAPRIVMIGYHIICGLLDIVFRNRPIDRFWFLETVARMPYLSYVTMLHIYETLGWWEIDGPLKILHTSEEINETMHLRIMESLGGDSLWWNRFIARHGAIVYFTVLIVMFMVSPKLAYLSSELLEMHAVHTYTEFYETNEKRLKMMKPTAEALEYDPYSESFYDIFRYIASDELGHARAMKHIRR